MEDFYTYIGQVNIALGIFCLFYRFLFAGDTFFAVRRGFLLSAVLLAFLYPFISLAGLLKEQAPLQEVFAGYVQAVDYAVSVVAPVEGEHFLTWENVIVFIWGTGVVILGVRMLLQLAALGRLLLKSRKTVLEGMRIVTIPAGTAPFSFFNWIFVCPDDHSPEELHHILLHEATHTRQYHSWDMILSEVLCTAFWLNPAVWLLRKYIRQNLEFLADDQVVNTGCDRKNYQYDLLRLSHRANVLPIVNNFNVSQLKKRIMMMNKKKTSRLGLLKYVVLLPVTVVLVLAGNARTVAEIVNELALPGEVPEMFRDGKMLPVIDVSSQQRKEGEKCMKGRVVDENGQPIPAVSIIMKNSSVGTLSDKKGNFLIRGYDSGILCFSYVGKDTREIPYTKGTKELKVVMNQVATELEEIVVVAYVPDTTEVKPQEEEKEIFVVVEDMPRFKEGQLGTYLARHIKYPVRAAEKGIEGKVFVTFVIDKQGKVKDAKVARSVEASLDKEALRIVETMPDWKPGKQRGIPVDVQFTLPIDFKLQKMVVQSK